METTQSSEAASPGNPSAVDESRLQRIANRRHATLANLQLLAVTVVLGAVILAPDIRLQLSQIIQEEDSIWRDLLRVTAVFGPIVLAAVLHIALSVMIILLRYDWRQAISQAHSSDRPEKCAEGFMAILSNYNKIRVRTLLGVLFSVSLIYIGTMSVITQFGENQLNVPILILGALEIGSGVALYVRSRLLDRMFLPGHAIVGQTLELAIRAASSNESITRAQAAADRLEADIIAKTPWWYFPKSDHD